MKIDNSQAEFIKVIYIEYYSKMIKLAVRFTGLIESAQNIVQDVFTALMKEKQIEHLRGIKENEVYFYLMTATRNRAINYLKKQNAQLKYEIALEDDIDIGLENWENPVDTLIEREYLISIIKEAFQKMNPKYAEALIQKYVFGRTDQEIADIIKVNVKSMNVYYSRAKRQFKKWLEENP